MEKNTAIFTVLRKLATPIRLSDLEKECGMYSFQMRKVFWKVLKNFYKTEQSVLKFWYGLLQRRARIYAESIFALGYTTEKCVGSLECTKIQIWRPEGHGTLKRSLHFGYEKFYLLIFMTLTTSDALLFSSRGSIEGRSQDQTVPLQSRWKKVLQSNLSFGGDLYSIYGDFFNTLRPKRTVPFHEDTKDVAEIVFNTSVTAMRVAVEWDNRDLEELYSFTNL